MAKPGKGNAVPVGAGWCGVHEHCYHDVVYQPRSVSLSHQRATLALAAMILAGCAAEPDMLELRGLAMGTAYSVRVVRPSDGLSLTPDRLGEDIAARLDEIEDRFSTYRPDSDVSRFNAHRGREWFSVSPDFLDVLKQGIAVSELSGGAFDITVGPLVELWGFGAGGEAGRIPQREALDGLLAATGSVHLQWRESPPAVRRTRPGVQLDFSAIAKGYAVDEIWTLLLEAGVSAYLVEIGGEVRTRGRRADGRDWSIGIESPDGTGVTGAVPLRNAAIATSGDYRNYFEHEGVRYSHVLDPRTGWPVSHELAEVSVIGSTAAAADALATALLVLGPAAGVELAERRNIAARMVLRTADGLKVLQTAAYEASIGR